MKDILIFLLKLYKVVISPFFEAIFGKACRFTPTCSQYTIDALRKHGAVKGLYLGAVRLSHCHA